MIEQFYTALTAKLRADATLVTLTGYTATRLNICRGEPKAVAIYPSLLYREATTQPAIYDGPSQVKVSTVEFWAVAKTELAAMRIADRLDALTRVDGVQQHLQYWSISNAEVANCMTRWRHHDSDINRIGNIAQDEKIDAWTHRVVIDFWWYLKL